MTGFRKVIADKEILLARLVKGVASDVGYDNYHSDRFVSSYLFAYRDINDFLEFAFLNDPDTLPMVIAGDVMAAGRMAAAQWIELRTPSWKTERERSGVALEINVKEFVTIFVEAAHLIRKGASQILDAAV